MGKAQRMKLQRAAGAAQPKPKRQANTTYLVICCAILIVINLVVYLQVAGFGFSRMDDQVYVTENPHVKAGLTVASLRWAFTAAHAGNWHPLTWISHMLDIELFGLNANAPGMHHVTTMVLHIVNTLLLFAVLVALTDYIWRSAFVAALFAVHPQHVESVAWVAERKDVLSTLFFLLAILLYVRYARQPNVKRYLPVALAFALGLLAKPMLVTLPIVLLILDYWPLRRFRISDFGFRNALVEKLPLLALTAISCGMTIWAQGKSEAICSLDSLSAGIRGANAAMSSVIYLLKTFWPVKLAAYYPHPADTWPTWQVAGSVVLLVCVTAVAIRFARKAPYLLAGWLWYLVTLVPVIGLMQVGSQARADRYTYIPLIGVFVMIAWGIGELLARKPDTGRTIAVGVAGAIVIAALIVPARVQASYWKDPVSTYSHAIAVTENNWFAENGLGEALKDKNNMDAAVASLKRSLAHNPYHTPAYNNLGLLLTRQGKPDEAVECYREGIKHGNGSGELYDNMATALAVKGDLAEAIKYFRMALRTNPESSVTHFNLGLTLSRNGQVDSAIEEYQRSLKLDDRVAVCHNNLGILLANKGRLVDALPHFEAAARLEPQNPAAKQNLEYIRSLIKSGTPLGGVR